MDVEMTNPLDELMDEHDTKISDLIEGLSISESSVYLWVKGSHIPTRGNIKLLLDFFGINDEQERYEWKLKFKKWRRYKNE